MIQQTLYGSPLRSGYGSLDTLFEHRQHCTQRRSLFSVDVAVAHARMAARVGRAPCSARVADGPAPDVRHRQRRLPYLPYVVFNDWWYLRFMLPAIAVLLVLTAATIRSIAALRPLGPRYSFFADPQGPRRTLGPCRHCRSAPHCRVFSPLRCVSFHPARHARGAVFDLQRLESRYERAGEHTLLGVFRRTRSSSRAGRAAASASIRIARRWSGTRSIPRGWIPPLRSAAHAASNHICCSSGGKSRCSASGLPAVVLPRARLAAGRRDRGTGSNLSS